MEANKTVTLLVEFVKQAHREVCSSWKRKIEEQLPDLFKGKGWYIREGFPSAITYFDGVKMSYGLDANGDWFNNVDEDVICNIWSDEFVRANQEEIKSCLMNEARRRGLYTDCYIKDEVNGKRKINGPFYKLTDRNELWIGSSMLFKDGRWVKLYDKNTERIEELKATIMMSQLELDRLIQNR